MLIEVFRSGEHRDSGGNTQFYSKEKLKLIADLYNSRVAEDSSSKAPIVKGHPKSDDPALGWVDYLQCDEDILKAKVSKVDPEFMHEIKDGKFKKISISLYDNLVLKHIGFLGAAAPAVKGLQNVEYSDNTFAELQERIAKSDGVTTRVDSNFDYQELEKKSRFLKEQFDKLTEVNVEKSRKIEELQNKIKQKEFKEFSMSINDSRGAKLSPASCGRLNSLLNKAYKVEMESGDSELLNNIKDFVQKIDFINLSEEMEESFAVHRQNFAGKKVVPERMSMHEKALSCISSNPNLSYEEALNISEYK